MHRNGEIEIHGCLLTSTGLSHDVIYYIVPDTVGFFVRHLDFRFNRMLRYSANSAIEPMIFESKRVDAFLFTFPYICIYYAEIVIALIFSSNQPRPP